MNYPSAKPLHHWKRYDPTEARAHYEQQTPGQTAAIRAVSNSQRINADAACQHLFGCAPDSLNKLAAATFVQWLKQQPIQFHASSILRFCPTADCNQLQAVSYDGASCGNGHFYRIEHKGEVA
jgi:hypothetical protein